MFVRTAGERDLAAVRDVLVETWHATYDALYGAEKVREITDVWHSIGALRRLLMQPYSEFIVADTGAGLAGMAYASMNEKDRQIVELRELYVLPAMQGKGIGGLLLDEIESSFFGCNRMRLEVEERNSRALAFYEAAGFVRTAGKPARRWADASILTLEKQLA
jgi:ribosomal protein S18 acetylase RimI-like enzyme